MSWVHSGLFVLASMLGGAVQPYAATHPAIYAGTYAIRICHDSCEGPAYFAGTIVLFDRPLQDSQGRTFRADLDLHPANGCFIPSMATGKEFVSIDPRKFFSWAVHDGTVTFDLARSPDAGYGVRLELAPKGLRGKGSVWGDAIGAVAPGLPPEVPDTVVADRLGDADIKSCPPAPRPVARPVGMIGR